MGGAGNLIRDGLSGAVVAIISVAYCASFAALIFAGALAPGFAQGLNAILLGAGVAGLAVALGSSLPRAVGGPDTPVVAVFSALAISIIADAAGDGVDAPSTDEMIYLALAAISVATFVTGLFLATLGAFRIGSALRFVPYSVVSGFLAASGCLLLAGAFKIATGAPLDLERPDALLDAVAAGGGQLLFAGGLVVAVFLLRLRFRHFYVLPLAFCACIGLIHAYLAMEAPLNSGAWLLDATLAPGFSMPAFEPERLLDVAPTIAASFGEIAAVAVITALAVVLNTSGLEAVWKANSDLDQEFRTTGLGNVLAGLVGGIAGNISLNRSMLNGECGAATRLSAALPALACIALIFVGGDILALIPTPALAGLLGFLGVSIIVTSLAWRSIARNWPEFMLTWLIAALILLVGYLEGLFVGLVGAALLFAYNYSRVDIVKRAFTRRDRSSTVDRAPDDMRFLAENGGLIQGYDLHGYLFFATSSRLVEDLKRRLQGDVDDAPPAYLLIDFRLVTGVDISTALSFAKLRNACDEAGATLLLSAMQPDIAAALNEGPQAIADGELARRFPSLDEALEWAEEDLLRRHAAELDRSADFEGWLARQLGGAEHGRSVMGYLDQRRFQPGERVVAQGDASDTVDLFVTGRVRVTLDRPGEAPLRLRSMLGHTVLGEMGFYRGTPRTASVIAERETTVYRMQRDAYDRMAIEAPTAAAAFDRFIIRTLADRLSFANSEIAAQVV